MARKTRKDRDLERQSKSTIYIEVHLGLPSTPSAHQVLLPPPDDGAASTSGASPSRSSSHTDALLPCASQGNLDAMARSSSSGSGSFPVGVHKGTPIITLPPPDMTLLPAASAALPAGLAASAAPTQPLEASLATVTAAGLPFAADMAGACPMAAAATGGTAHSTDTAPAAGSMTSEASSGRAGEGAAPAGSKPCWEKVLWKQQAYPDNYVHDSFLKELVVNAQVPTRSFTPVALDAAAVCQQLSLVVAAVVLPTHLHAGRVSAQHMMVVDAILLLLGYAVCAVLGGHLLGGSLVRGVRQCGLLVGGVYLLSPLLKTLAATISPDSIIALTAAALIAHLLLHDYSFVNAVTPRLTGTVALAAAAVSSVLVASMMPSELHVFVQVLFSLELYLLYPYVRRYIRNASSRAHVACTVLLALLASALCLPCSRALAAVCAAAHVALGLGCPALLVRIQKYKAKINGPWDEAVPHIPQELQVGGGPTIATDSVTRSRG